MRSRIVLGAAMIAAMSAVPGVSLAEEMVASGEPGIVVPSRTPKLTQDQLADLVAPLALYPDGLLSQVLVASTYPLEVVQANQWLRRNGRLKGQELTEAARQQPWDASVQALVAFPDVLARLNEDVEWTTSLGNAFLAQQPEVLAAVQRMRSRAQASGKLASNAEQSVNTVTQDGKSAIEIVPANDQVVYVPEYDPTDIWGEPLASAYPPLEYSPGYVYGPPVDVGFWFGPWAGWGWGWAWGWGWGPNWYGGSVYCNGAFFHHHGYHGYYGHGGNDGHGGNGGHGGHGGPPGSGSGPSGHMAWSHDPGHRQGVPYPNGQLTGRYQAASMAARSATLTARTWNRTGAAGSAPNQLRTAAGGRGGVADRPGRTTGDAWRQGRGTSGGQTPPRYLTPTQGSNNFRSALPRQQLAPRQFAQGGSGRTYSSVPRSGGAGSPRVIGGGQALRGGGGAPSFGGGSAPRPMAGGQAGSPSYGGGGSHPSGGGGHGSGGGGSHGRR